jgi:hypothetical protein
MRRIRGPDQHPEVFWDVLYSNKCKEMDGRRLTSDKVLEQRLKVEFDPDTFWL